MTVTDYPDPLRRSRTPLLVLLQLLVQQVEQLLGFYGKAVPADDIDKPLSVLQVDDNHARIGGMPQESQCLTLEGTDLVKAYNNLRHVLTVHDNALVSNGQIWTMPQPLTEDGI